MPYTTDQLDQTNLRIIEIEKNLCIMQENITAVSDHIRETQRYLIKLAHHQSEIAKRLSSWPFIAVTKQSEE
jgi:uncharacterized coiled-coil protein SlyX